jgi:hypothetical protein
MERDKLRGEKEPGIEFLQGESNITTGAPNGGYYSTSGGDAVGTYASTQEKVDDPTNHADHVETHARSWTMNYTDPTHLVSPSEPIVPPREKFFTTANNTTCSIVVEPSGTKFRVSIFLVTGTTLARRLYV